MNTYWTHAVVWSAKERKHMAVTYVSKKGKEYAQAIRDLTLQRKAWFYSGEPLHMRILVCFGTKAVQDIDNRIKPLLDALAHAGVYKNDSQVKIVEAREGPTLKPAVCFVWLDEFIPDPVGNLRWIRNPVS